jgi:hypothetical protein
LLRAHAGAGIVGCRRLGVGRIAVHPSASTSAMSVRPPPATASRAHAEGCESRARAVNGWLFDWSSLVIETFGVWLPSCLFCASLGSALSLLPSSDFAAAA